MLSSKINLHHIAFQLRDRQEHGKHEHHKNHRHRRGEHADHKHGEHHDSEIAPQGRVKVGDKVPDFSVRTPDDKNIKLSELQKDAKRTKNGVVWSATLDGLTEPERAAAVFEEWARPLRLHRLAIYSPELALQPMQ